MKMKPILKALFFLLLLSFFVLTGCNRGSEVTSDTSNASDATPSNEPVTLSFLNNGGIPDAYYEENILKPIQEAFPHVTLKYYPQNEENSIANLIASDEVPDILYFVYTGMMNFRELDLLEDLHPLIKKNDIDISVFRPSFIEAIEMNSNEGELNALPWTYGSTALFYNKDIFDKFGVDYPVDGMYWDELIPLIVRLTRTEDNIDYRGFDMAPWSLFNLNQLSAPYVDAESKRAMVNSDKWRTLFETFAAMYHVPGNEMPASWNGQRDFIEERNVAMVATGAIYPALINMEENGDGIHWDIVSLPTFREAPGMWTSYNGAIYSVSSTSTKKDIAIQLIAHVTSERVQKDGAAILRYPTLQSTEVMDAFGKGNPILESKNIQALQVNDIPPGFKPTKYDGTASGIVNRKFLQVARQEIDVVTALREAEAEINQELSTMD